MSEIVDIFKAIVQDVSIKIALDYPDIPYVFYEHGHILEIDNTLASKDKANLYMEKYPLIMLIQDFTERQRNSFVELNLRLIITTGTKSDIRASQRYEQVFKPVLIPIYNQLMQSIFWHGSFFWDSGRLPSHNRTDRPFYGIGTDKGNTRYIMSDKLDAIEITNLNLNYFDNKCL